MSAHIASAGNIAWITPPEILNPVRELFGGTIHLDPCWGKGCLTNPTKHYSLPENDGLVDPWDAETIFVNPPFGVSYIHQSTRECLSTKEFHDLDKKSQLAFKVQRIDMWIDKCVQAHIAGSEVVALIPTALSTKKWQHTIRDTATAVCHLLGRIKFLRLNGESLEVVTGAPMDCSLVYWGEKLGKFDEIFNRHDRGICWYPQVNTIENLWLIARLENAVLDLRNKLDTEKGTVVL